MPDRKEYNRLYRLNNKEKIKEKKKEYDQTPEGKKTTARRNWKKRGLDMDTFYYVYPIFLNAKNCERCGVEFEGRGNNRKCMDHCHSTGMFRNIVCHRCNNIVIPHI
jgi:hypothetical protein